MVLRLARSRRHLRSHQPRLIRNLKASSIHQLTSSILMASHRQAPMNPQSNSRPRKWTLKASRSLLVLLVLYLFLPLKRSKEMPRQRRRKSQAAALRPHRPQSPPRWPRGQR